MLSFKSNSLSWIELVTNKLNKNKIFNLANISTGLFGSIILIISAKIKVVKTVWLRYLTHTISIIG